MFKPEPAHKRVTAVEATIEEAREPASDDDYLKVKARIAAALAEAQEDEEKRKLYFGYLETSEGNL
ncbi:MAG: hypothetical protein NTAFB05_13660 [Nitrobacter sp.]